MKKTFDNVLPELVRICESHGDFDKIKHVIVVRDLKGCVRLVIRPNDREIIDTETLKTSIATELEGYFKPPILTTNADNPDERRLAIELANRASVWTPPDYEDRNTGNAMSATANKWKKIERRLSKQEWVDVD